MAAGETKFERMKRQVETQRRLKIQGEARKASLKEEADRILKEVQEEIGQSVSSIEELEVIQQQENEKIINDISEMEKIFREEGIEI